MVEIKDIFNLFQADDGSLPDIFVTNLTTEQVETAYAWVLSHSTVSGKLLTCDILGKEEFEIPYKDAATHFNLSNTQTIRFSLEGLHFNGSNLSGLTIALEEKGELSFDYRMGPEWDEACITAFFELLSGIKNIAQSAQLFHSDDGDRDNPNTEFAKVFTNYYNTNRTQH
jgi:hypothetical protein